MTHRRGFVLRQVVPGVDSARDRKIRAAALRTVRGNAWDFSRYVRGLTCPCCGSFRTKTEFYRGASGKPIFGVTACDDCGAC